MGTDLHIAPTLGDSSLKTAVKREVDTLSENMVISLEPGIFYPGVGGGALENEDTFAVIGASVAENFGVNMPEGTIGHSILKKLV